MELSYFYADIMLGCSFNIKGVVMSWLARKRAEQSERVVLAGSAQEQIEESRRNNDPTFIKNIVGIYMEDVRMSAITGKSATEDNYKSAGLTGVYAEAVMHDMVLKSCVVWRELITERLEQVVFGRTVPSSVNATNTKLLKLPKDFNELNARVQAARKQLEAERSEIDRELVLDIYDITAARVVAEVNERMVRQKESWVG